MGDCNRTIDIVTSGAYQSASELHITHVVTHVKDPDMPRLTWTITTGLPRDGTDTGLLPWWIS